MLIPASMHCIYKIVLATMRVLLRFLNVATLSDLSFRGNGISASGVLVNTCTLLYCSRGTTVIFYINSHLDCK